MVEEINSFVACFSKGKYLYRFGRRIDNPRLSNACTDIELLLCPPVAFFRGGRKDFDHKIRGTLDIGFFDD